MPFPSFRLMVPALMSSINVYGPKYQATLLNSRLKLRSIQKAIKVDAVLKKPDNVNISANIWYTNLRDILWTSDDHTGVRYRRIETII